jgi:hypothetical protein
LALALPAVFLQGSFTYCREADRAVRTSDALGGTMARLPQGAVVSDFIMHDMVARAIPPGSRRTFILSEDSLIETTDLPLKDVLLIQSRLGGRPGSGIATRAYASGISRSLASEASPLKRQAAELTAGTPSIFLVLPLNRTSLFPAELELFKTAPFREFIRPTLYRFSASDR